jgi:hypothetical protein
MSRRLIVHVGTPKSGTSYLQDRLACNRARLLEDGIDYVETRTGDHFEAALDLLDDSWAGAEERARGQWRALVSRARGRDGDVLVTHEILAAASPEAVARLRADFPDHEHHVVLTARDLGRQLPAEWQENVKHRSVRSYERFLRRTERRYETPTEDRFWRVQHVPEILRTWSHDLPAGRVHLVTVPPSGARRGLLWERYTEALGLADTTGYADTTTTNASLGSAEVTLLRLLNLELQERGLPRPEYVQWVREGLVRQELAASRGSAPATVPPDRRAWVAEIAESWIAVLAGAGFDVVGDLAELRPDWPDDADAWSDPDAPDPDAALARAVDALAWTIEHAARNAPAPVPVDQPVTPRHRLARVLHAWRRP